MQACCGPCASVLGVDVSLESFVSAETRQADNQSKSSRSNSPRHCNFPNSHLPLTLFYNGDNMDTEQEFGKRLEAVRVVAERLGAGVIVEPYIPHVFGGCEDCIRHRLCRCARVARAFGYDAFTTSLTVSPHKDTKMVNRIGREVGEAEGVRFIELDLKKKDGFGKSVRASKELGLYRQNYCGCAKSVRQ